MRGEDRKGRVVFTMSKTIPALAMGGVKLQRKLIHLFVNPLSFFLSKDQGLYCIWRFLKLAGHKPGMEVLSHESSMLLSR